MSTVVWKKKIFKNVSLKKAEKAMNVLLDTNIHKHIIEDSILESHIKFALKEKTFSRIYK